MRTTPPATVAVYVAVSTGTVVAGLIAGPIEWNRLVVAALALIAFLILALWRGSQVAWWCLLVLDAGALATYAADPSPLWPLPLNVISLCLLVSRPTRRFVFEPAT